MEKVYAQVAGAIAIIFWVISIQTNKKRKVLYLQIIANVFYAIQYGIIGQISAALMNCVSIVRMKIINEYEKKEKVLSFWYVIIFSLVIVIIGAITYTSLFGLIPIITTILYTYATWQKNTKFIRFFFLISAFIWIYFNLTAGVYVALIGNAFEVISACISIYRFDIKKEKSEKNDIKES